MTAHLNTAQQTRLRILLQEREQALRTRLAAHYGNASRVEHARDLLLQDGDDAPQRDADREVDQAMNDHDSVELDQIRQALTRLQQGSHGQCQDCGEVVPFERLLIEPQTLRCVACESAREHHAPRRASL